MNFNLIVICDERNNSPEVIDNLGLVCDVFISFPELDTHTKVDIGSKFKSVYLSEINDIHLRSKVNCLANSLCLEFKEHYKCKLDFDFLSVLVKDFLDYVDSFLKIFPMNDKLKELSSKTLVLPTTGVTVMDCSKKDSLGKQEIINLTTVKQDKPFLVNERDILASISYCLAESSPYIIPDNIFTLLNNLLLIIQTSPEMLEAKKSNLGYIYFEGIDPLRKYLYPLLRSCPSYRQLNLTKHELDLGYLDSDDPNRPIRFGSSSRYHQTKSDYDFIDLDAFEMNVSSLIYKLKSTEYGI